ncbi:N-glycanase 1, putative, partial [Entamoeba invadens IP1]
MKVYYLTNEYVIDSSEIKDSETLFALVISVIGVSECVMLQLPNLFIVKDLPLPKEFNTKQSLFVLTQELVNPLSKEVENACTRCVIKRPFLQRMTNDCCKSCTEICKNVPVSTCVRLGPFIPRLMTYLKQVEFYEDPQNQKLALQKIPLEQLHITQDQITNRTLDIDQMKDIVHWFKTEFFHWVEDYCLECGSKDVSNYSDTPNADDFKNDANRVEIFKCNKCGHIRRFPRYNNPLKLLKTRVGRCGEYANCFTFICRSLGYYARLVLDTTDHVWTEFFSHSEDRYVHVDSCEDKVDFPLTYERGWGKKLEYCIAFSNYEMRDVTSRYTERLEDCLPRRNDISESLLSSLLAGLNIALLYRADTTDVIKWEHTENDEFSGKKKIERKWEAIGRISGEQKWKEERGENKKMITPTDFKTKLVINSELYGEACQVDDTIRVTKGYDCSGGVFKCVTAPYQEHKNVLVHVVVTNKKADADGFAGVFASK